MEILHLDDSSFKEAVNTEKVVLVDFFATWCGPCRMLAPVLEEVRKELDDNFVIAKLDVDEAEKTARSFGVMSVPTLIIFKNGEEIDRLVGVKPKAMLVETLKAKL